MTDEIIIREKAELISQIKACETQKKALEEQEKLMRDNLLEAMTEYGVWDLEVDGLKVTRIPETTRDSFDSKKFKADEPLMYAMYTKTSPVKQSLRIKVE